MPKKPKARRPSLKEAVEHKCHSCQGEYVDGKKDCEVTSCSLYYWMPYREHMPDYNWEQYAPRAKGTVLKEDRKTERSPEHIAKMQAGRKKPKVEDCGW